MGSDAKTSVVDPWCRSWDVPNLFVCDGSVFVTSSAANPSLTIQAIATRTADYIVERSRTGDLFRTSGERTVL
jgi:choline dehydrogenase-like flavoprotein